jgi:hypothetical protein
MAKKFKYVAGVTDSGKPVMQEVVVGSGKGQCASGEGRCQEHMTVQQWEVRPNAAKMGDLSFADNDEYSNDSVSLNAYGGLSKDSIIDEAQTRKGSPLTPEEATVAAALGSWYEDGTISANTSYYADIDGNINFTDVSPIKKGDKTIGVVAIGGPSYKYFYEIEDGELSFRQADGFDEKTGKLPFNYGMRKKLTSGEQIQSNNSKWRAEAILGAHGM